MADEYDDSFLFEDEPVKSGYDDSFLFDDDQPEVEAAAPAVEPEADTLGESLSKVVENTPERWQKRAGGLMAIAGDKDEQIKSVFSPLFNKAKEGEKPGFMDYFKTAANMATSLPAILRDQFADKDSIGAQGQKWLSDKGREIAAAAQEEINLNQAMPDNPVTQFAVDVARGAIDMGPMLAAGFLTRSPSAGTVSGTLSSPLATGIFAGQVAGDTYIDRLEKGVGQSEAMDAVKFNMLAEAIPESITVAQTLLKRGSPFIKRFINSALGEGVQETATAILQDTYDNVTLENMSLKDALLSLDPKNVLYQGAVGMGVGGVLSMPASAADAATRKQEYDKTPFAPTHKVSGGIDAMPVTKNGQPVPDTYMDRSGQIHRDRAAVPKPVIPPSEFDGGPLDASLQVDAIKAEVMGGTVDMPVDLAITPDQQIEQLKVEAAQKGITAPTEVNQYVQNALSGEQVELIDHGKVQAPAPEAIRQAEIERVEKVSEQPSGLPAAYEGEYKIDVPRTDSVIKPQKPSDYDKKALQGELNKLSKEGKAIEKARGGTVVESLASKGGLNIESMVSSGMDKADARDNAKKGVPFGKPLFRAKGGMTMDEAAEAMAEMGVPGVMTEQGPDLNVAFELIHDTIKSGEPLYLPGDEAVAAEQADRRKSNEVLTAEYEAKLGELDTYEEILAADGQKAADEWFYRQRAAESYDVNAEVVYEGENITADSALSDEHEALSALIDKAIAINPGLVQGESERLIDSEDSEIAMAMYKIIEGKEFTERRIEGVERKERRANQKARDYYSALSHADLVEQLLKHELTNVKGRRSFVIEQDEASHFISVDADSLKWVNDNMSPDNGDKLLQAVADELVAEFGFDNIYHISGDEFYVLGFDKDSDVLLKRGMETVEAALSEHVITAEKPDGTQIKLKGLAATPGYGTDKGAADYDLKQSKQSRQEEGRRAARGETPTSAAIEPTKGKPDIERDRAETDERAGIEGREEPSEPAAEAAPEKRRDEGDIAPEPLEVAGELTAAEEIDVAVKEAATSKENNLPEPTEAQKEAGNYKKAHITVQGLDIAIENPAGSKRNPAWPVIKHHYGYIKGTVGADSEQDAAPHEVEQVDVFVNPDVDIAADNPIFIVDQFIDGKFDEHKILVGFLSKQEAADAYNSNYTKDWDGLKNISELTSDEFKTWLSDGDTTVSFVGGEKAAPVEEEVDVPRETTTKPLEEKPVTEEKLTKKAEAEASKILTDANVAGKDRLETMAKFRDGAYSLDDLREAYPAEEVVEPEVAPVAELEVVAKKPAEPEKRALAEKITDVGEKPLFSRVSEPVEPIFYSQMQSVLNDKLPGKGTGMSYRKAIQSWAKKGEFKQEELEWSGVDEWLQENAVKKLTKQDVLDFVTANQIEVQEVEKGGFSEAEKQLAIKETAHKAVKDYAEEQGLLFDDRGPEGYSYLIDEAEGETVHEGLIDDIAISAGLDDEYFNEVEIIGDVKFEEYQLPGGESYREMLLTLPQKKTTKPYDKWLHENFTGVDNKAARDLYEIQIDPETPNFRSGHYDEPNILAHIRYNERTDADGKRVLFVEEVQSDWHQAGRKKGYQEYNKAKHDELRKRVESEGAGSLSDEDLTLWNQYQNKGKIGGVPNAPFKTTWPLLAMKRMIRHAAENGFDSIAWTTGEQQAARYDLSKQVDGISIEELETGDYKVTANKDDSLVIDQNSDKNGLADLVGKEIADKALKQFDEGSVQVDFDGEDLKVGGKGMAGFYDNILPKTVNKYVKKWGGKVGETSIKTYEGAGRVIDPRLGFDSDKFSDVHSLAITPAMKRAALSGQPLFAISTESKADKKPAKSITNTDLNRIVGRFQQEYKGTQPVEIHVRGMQDETFGEGSIEKDGRIKGGFYPGTNEAVLIAENIENKMDAIRVIRHEIVGHYGFRQLLNKDGEYDALLDRVYASRDKGLKDLYSFVEKTYPELIERGDTKVIADEMIARAAEIKSKSGLIKRIFDEIIRLLNKFGIAKGLVSRTELRSLIRLSEKNLRMPISEPVAGDGVEPLLAKDEALVFAPMVLQAVKDLGFENSITPDGKLKVFHGSSESNINKILKSGEFKGFPFFALDRETADKFSRQAGGKPKVIELIVDPDIVVPTGGYLSARIEGLKLQEDNTWSADADLISPNILFSRNERAGNANVGDTLGMPEEEYKEKFVRLFQNSFNRIKKLQQVIEERGGVVSDEGDIYQAEELSSGKITARLNMLDKNHMKPLIAQMDRDKITIDELDQYLMAKHATERNDYIASINEDMPDGGSGMTNAESVEIINSFGDKASAMEEAVNRVYAVNKQTLDDLVEGGHLEQDTVNEWRERYDYYVPLKGKEGAGGRPVLGKGYSVSGAGIQTALGRGEGNLAESPTAHTFAQAESTVVRTEKTKVGQALVNLMRENPDPDFWTMGERTFSQFVDLFGEPFEGYETAPEGLIENIDYHRVSAITKAERQAAKAEGRKPVSKVVYKLDPGYKRRDDVFSVMIAGKEVLINIKDELVAEQLKKMNASQLNALVASAGMVNRYLAMINTALNPEFVITNLERDFQTAMVNLSGEQSAKMAYDVAKGMPGAARGIMQSTFDTKGQSEWREVYEEMKDAGGTIGFFGLEDIDTKVKHIQNRLDRKRGMLGASKRGIVNVRDAVLDANLSVENAARLSAYKIAKEQWIANGMPEQEAKNKAASLAKNLTVNFNRKGELAPVLNSAYLFYNASIQGSARILTALGNPRVRKIVAGIAATSFALAMYNRAAGGDDDDGVPYWDKISDYTKQTNLIIMHPDGSGEYSKIKLPYGYNVFFYAGTAMNDLMYDDKKTTMGTAMNMLSATMNAFNPIQGADLLDTITPTVLKPMEQSARNINFMTGQIKPEYPFDAYDRPESQKSFKSTNPQLKEMMAIINAATGGDETHAGLIDISPETIKHYTSWLTGGAGMFATRTLGAAVSLATGEEIDQKNIPFVRTLGGKTGSHYDTQRFYDAVKEVAAVEAQLKIYRGTDQYSEYKSDNMAVHKLAFHVRKYKNKIKRLRGKRDKAYSQDDHDLAREYREEIRQEMMEFSQKFDNAAASQ